MHICLPRSLRQTCEACCPRNRYLLLGVTPVTTTVLPIVAAHDCAVCRMSPQYHYVYSSSKTLTWCLHWGLRGRIGRRKKAQTVDGAALLYSWRADEEGRRRHGTNTYQADPLSFHPLSRRPPTAVTSMPAALGPLSALA